jgi:hypothetical protein
LPRGSEEGQASDSYRRYLQPYMLTVSLSHVSLKVCEDGN